MTFLCGLLRSTTAFTLTGAQNAAGPARRLTTQQPALGGMGRPRLEAWAPMRLAGNGGISFKHILSRLPGELQKSRETGAER